MSATHWHASDTFGFLLLGAVVAAALWASRRR
jgi:MYXO-CTERM domain-containing protein